MQHAKGKDKPLCQHRDLAARKDDIAFPQRLADLLEPLALEKQHPADKHAEVIA